MKYALLAIALLAAPLPLGAAPTCSIDSVVGVALGSYNVFMATALDSSGSVTYSCSGALAADLVAIELSAGGAGSFAPRRLTAGAATLNYNLYLDAARTNIWGDGTGSTSRYTLTGVGNNSSNAITVYGRAPALQNAAVGNYSDTITVTLVF